MENKNNQLSLEIEAQSSSSSSSSPYAPGYRFMPTDQELISEYLTRKVNNEPIPIVDINGVNLYEHSPQHLAVNYPQLGDNEWYFFTPRDRKYPNGNRPNRAVGEVGFWKATGADKAIESNGDVIGRKKVLVFYVGKPKSEATAKTDWIMHEYRLNAPSKSPNTRDMRLDDWVLCRIYRKPERSNRRQRDVEEDVIENTVALNIHNNNAVDQSQLNINNNTIDQSQDGCGHVTMIEGSGDHNKYQPNYYYRISTDVGTSQDIHNNNAVDQSQLNINNNNNVIVQSQLNINNNNNNTIDQSQDGRGHVTMIKGSGDHNEYQPNYYRIPADVGTSRDMNLDYGFDYSLSLYDQQYKETMWGNYGVGNQGSNNHACGLDGDLKKIFEDFIRDEEGFPNDDEQPEAKRRKN